MMLKSLKIRSVQLVMLAVLAGVCAAPVSAQWGRFHRRYGWGNDHYYGWRFHGHWFWQALFAPPIGAYLADLPYGYTVVEVGGIPYYYYGNVYLRPYYNGYIVVDEPVATAEAAPAVVQPSTSDKPQSGASAQTPAKSDTSGKAAATAAKPESTDDEVTTVNVPNSNGTFTAVKLTKHGKGYLGPQGEFYVGHPTVAQLKALYGE